MVQLAVDAGPAGPLALAWAGLIVLTKGQPWLVGVAFGLLAAALTQDWIGDLEVLRAAAVWAALALAGTGRDEEMSR